MCSQPIVHDAQLLRATLRIRDRSSAASRGAPAKSAAWKLRVGRVLIALNASRLASVPSSRYLAVAGPNERARRSRAAASTACGSAGATLAAARTAAAAGVPPVVGDGRVPHPALARGPDHGRPPAAAQALPEQPLGLRRRPSP